MSGLFGGGDSPPVAPANRAPSLPDPAVVAAAEEERRVRGGRGRAGTIFTNPLGVQDEGSPGKGRKYLGSR